MRFDPNKSLVRRFGIVSVVTSLVIGLSASGASPDKKAERLVVGLATTARASSGGSWRSSHSAYSCEAPTCVPGKSSGLLTTAHSGPVCNQPTGYRKPDR
jgi:hypothetical protein